MRWQRWILAALGLGLAAPAAAVERPFVAVLEVQAKGIQLDTGVRERLTEYLETLITQKGYQVVPRTRLQDGMRTILKEQKKDSYKEDCDESCQLELGKAVAAQKTLASQVLKIGTRCKLTMRLYDLQREATDAGGSSSGDCSEDEIVDSLERAVASMFGGDASLGVDLPGPGSAAPATDDRQAYRKELEKAWQALAAEVRKLGPEAQLEKYQAFLADYPVDNSYAAQVQKAVEGLEARLDKEAEAKRKAEEKATALDAERQRAAKLKEAYDDAKALTGPVTEQLEAWREFLSGYPDKNPYLSTAKRKVAELEAQAKKGPPGMARIPAGEFMMGCSPGDPDCFSEQRHRVWLDEFWIDKTEVTVGAYAKCVAAGRCQAAHFDETCAAKDESLIDAALMASAAGAEYAVACVDWDQARVYCEWAGKRLPTEAEWEKAARGGVDKARYGKLADIAWYRDNFDDAFHPVGRKKPNAYGLYDMLGNLWEWCADWAETLEESAAKAKVEAVGTVRNPTGPASGKERVVRGGAWRSVAEEIRSSGGGMTEPAVYSESHGFRCARSTAPAP